MCCMWLTHGADGFPEHCQRESSEHFWERDHFRAGKESRALPRVSSLSTARNEQ